MQHSCACCPVRYAALTLQLLTFDIFIFGYCRWAYGVCLWEIFSFGESIEVYCTMCTSEIAKYKRKLVAMQFMVCTYMHMDIIY